MGFHADATRQQVSANIKRHNQLLVCLRKHLVARYLQYFNGEAFSDEVLSGNSGLTYTTAGLSSVPQSLGQTVPVSDSVMTSRHPFLYVITSSSAIVPPHLVTQTFASLDLSF